MNRAEEMARARTDLIEAMAAGCSILELRRRRAALRADLRRRAHDEIANHTADLMTSPPAQRDFLSWESPWMGRD